MSVEILTHSIPLPAIARSAMRGEPDERYEPRPRGKDEWAKRAARVAAETPSDWLAKLAPALHASGEAARRLERSVAGKGVVVTTGQQPGLFGGPIYTLSKALSAVALADQLEARIGVPVAPVFWAATDDSDFREASRISVSVAGGARELIIEHTDTLGASMSQMPLGDVSAALAELVAASGSGLDSAPLALLRKLYRPGTTIGAAYVQLLRALLEPLGIAVLDASHPATRAAGRSVLLGALERGREIAAAVSANNGKITADGHELQVHDVGGLSLVFETSSEGRKRIPLKRSARSLSPAADLGPNVLLRPIMERQILPTIAYVGGPAEIAYFAQLGPIADTLAIPRPLIVPRWSCTIIEPHIRRILDSLELEMSEFQDPHAADAKIARAQLPRNVLPEVEKLRASVEKGVDSLASVLSELRYAPGQSLSEGIRRNLVHRLDRLERRLVAASKRRHKDLMHDIGTARGSLFPFGKPQERALSFIPFLVKYGKTLRDGMLAAASDHASSLL